MKLLTTIAAVLISISAFSQDYIEYENGTFTQNGEELSMEQIYDLTLLHKAGRGNVRRGNNFDEMHKDVDLRFSNNSLNSLGGATTGFVGILAVTVSPLLASIYGEWTYNNTLYFGAGTGLCAVSYKAFSRIALSPAGCLRKRDKEFHKVAGKLNEVIKASNQ
jgi:hypothetical protein